MQANVADVGRFPTGKTADARVGAVGSAAPAKRTIRSARSSHMADSARRSARSRKTLPSGSALIHFALRLIGAFLGGAAFRLSPIDFAKAERCAA
jgi:hypothetical protein